MCLLLFHSPLANPTAIRYSPFAFQRDRSDDALPAWRPHCRGAARLARARLRCRKRVSLRHRIDARRRAAVRLKAHPDDRDRGQRHRRDRPVVLERACVGDRRREFHHHRRRAGGAWAMHAGTPERRPDVVGGAVASDQLAPRRRRYRTDRPHHAALSRDDQLIDRSIATFPHLTPETTMLRRPYACWLVAAIV